MKKKTPIYPPLALLKKTTARYPDIWRKLELAHASNSVDNVSPWQRWCYVPISVTLAAAADIDKPADLDSWCLTAEAASVLAALAPWRLSKEVFVFDPEIQQLLFSQSGDLQITPDSLLKLPYHCFYIQFAGVLTSAATTAMACLSIWRIIPRTTSLSCAYCIFCPTPELPRS